MEEDVEKGTTASASADNGISNPLWNHDHHSIATGGHGHEHEHTNNTSSDHDHNHEHTNTTENLRDHSHEHHASIGCSSDHGHAHEHTHDEKLTSPDSDSAHHDHNHDHTAVAALGDGHDHNRDHGHSHGHDSHRTIGNDSSLDHPVTSPSSTSSPSKHTQDNNFRAAFLHVVMDAFVSVLVIIALVVARFVVLLHVTTLVLSIGFAIILTV